MRRSERQYNLSQQYNFTCKCTPCTDPDYLIQEAYSDALRCSHCEGPVPFPDKPCNSSTCLTCGETTTDLKLKLKTALDAYHGFNNGYGSKDIDGICVCMK